MKFLLYYTIAFNAYQERGLIGRCACGIIFKKGGAEVRCDCHIHIALSGAGGRACAPSDAVIEARIRDYALAGVRYLRDGGDKWGASLRARELAAGFDIKYVSPSFPIYRRSRYGAFIGLGYGSESEYLALLDRAGSDRADFIKLMLSGIMDFNEFGALSCQPLPDDEIAALISLAHSRGFKVMAHVNGDAPVRAAIRAGADSIEHANFMSRETIELLADSETVWVPTVSPVINAIGSGLFDDDVLRRIGAQLMENAALASSLGAYIALGSDCGAFRVEHPSGMEDELRCMRAAIGSGADVVLALGSSMIEQRFVRK